MYDLSACIGLEVLVQTNYMSSKISDAGNVSPSEYQEHRTKMIGSGHGLEVCKKEWHSAKVRFSISLREPFNLPL
jgi:hypothetical protein